MMFMILIDKINFYFYISLIVIRIVIVTIVDMIFSSMVGEMLQSKHQTSSFAPLKHFATCSNTKTYSKIKTLPIIENINGTNGNEDY